MKEVYLIDYSRSKITKFAEQAFADGLEDLDKDKVGEQ